MHKTTFLITPEGLQIFWKLPQAQIVCRVPAFLQIINLCSALLYFLNGYLTQYVCANTLPLVQTMK